MKLPTSRLLGSHEFVGRKPTNSIRSVCKTRHDERCAHCGGTMIRRLLVGLFFSLAVGIPFASSPPNEPILIKTTRLIDMSKGSIANEQAILINGATVVEIGPSSVVSQHAAGNVQVVDLTGLTVLPGLIDCQAHVQG